MLDYQLLEALLAVEKCQTFEKAAKELGITSSAVSQRIRLLEERIGAVLILRGTPCVPTDLGRKFCRHAETVSLLEKQLPNNPAHQSIKDRRYLSVNIAVNADSLATWFIKVIGAEMQSDHPLLPNIKIEDQDHTINLMKNGDVLAAVTTASRSVQGFKSLRLGALPYIATATPDYMAQNFPAGVTPDALKAALFLQYSEKDKLQEQWVKEHIDPSIRPINCYTMPSSQGFVDACLQSAGWGMNPEPLIREHLATGRLVPLIPDTAIETPLYWHYSRAIHESLSSFTQRVCAIAHAELKQQVATMGKLDQGRVE